ncbi:sugar ABC transporter permeases protein [Actinokineospora spheciospongiae]|uniref:Sugar ABC transporter permeases protein n=1 Tax=Actinokineospora spheciospongiae TaxID=909613 RepID=W7IG11_9PSEU|nr:sugar ABC transporter permease [Actinokineospora spheciospongiae]EWC59835.1 sugar ABC transporter permeases protein [Actinokineospora spheciospongiae]
MNRRGALAFWLFVGPFAAGLLLFTYVPIGWSAYLSFFDAHNTVTPTEFVGLDNYTDMLTDRAFLDSIGTFSAFAALIVPTTVVLSLLLALLVNQVRVARAFVRSVFFLPFACSYVVASLVWKMSLFSGVDTGVVNTVFGWFGGEPQAWVGTVDPPLYWVVLVTVRLWLQLGFYMVLFLAALQRIPDHLYEAAWTDGASPGWQTFRHVTLPGLRGALVAVLVLNLINAYQAFDEFYNILGDARGYPPFARPPLVYLYYTSLGSGGQDLGRGSAGALVLALLIALVTLLSGRVLRRSSS